MTNSEGRSLVAVLLNPPTGNGSRTLAHLGVAADCLACEAIKIVNLFPVASKDLRSLSDIARDSARWIDQRSLISAAILEGDEVLLGWGVSSLSGVARAHLQEQIKWLTSELIRSDVPAWVVGDGPRHPSRWHQYLSDRYQRTGGGPFADRVLASLNRYHPENGR